MNSAAANGTSRYARFVNSEYPRRLELCDNFQFRDVKELDRRLTEYALESSEPIVLTINSSGGSLAAALRLGEAIEQTNLKAHVYGLVIGDCLSAALLVLQSCYLRLACDWARFALHNSYIAFKVDADTRIWDIIKMVPQMFRDAPSTRMSRERVIKTLQRRVPNLSREELIDIMRQAKVVDVHEVLKLGFIDEVVWVGQRSNG